ncbi:hypothetical protein ABFV05_013088 [Capra hircus]
MCSWVPIDWHPVCGVDGCGPQNVLKPNLMKLMNASQQSKRNIEAKCGIVSPESTAFSEDNNSDGEIEDVVETIPEPSPGFRGFSHPAFPSPEPLPQPLKSLAGLGLTKARRSHKPEIVDKESDTDIVERAPQEQINHDRLSSVDGTHRNNRSDMTSALGLGEEEDIESPWDSESISESLPWKYVDLLSGAAGQRGKITLNGQVEDVSYIPSCMIGSRNFKMAKLEEPRHVGIPVAHMDSPEKYPNMKPAVLVRDSTPNKTVGMKDLQTSTSVTLIDLSAELDLKMTSEEEEEKPVGDENNHSQICKNANLNFWLNTFEEENKKHKSSEVEVSGNVCDTADESGLIQNPGVHRKEVKKKDNSKWTPEECVIAPIFEKTDSLTGGLLHVNDDSILSEVDQDDDRPAKKTSNENNKVQSKIKEQINSVDDLDDLTQSSETASKDGELLYYENSMLLRSVRGLQKELSETKEVKSQLEHQKVEWERELDSLRKKDQYSKEVEMKQPLELTLRALEMELKTVKNDLNQVIEERNDTQKQLSREQNGRMLQDGILANHLDKQKETEMANKEMNSEVSDSREEAKDLLCKNHVLQDELAMPRLEIDALNALTAENTRLNSKLENEKESKQRLEMEVESYHSRLAAASDNHDQSQTSKRDLELAFQRARDEWLHLQDKMKTNVANLKDNKEMLSQQLSRVENSLREKILILERVQRDLSQTECQKQEIEHTYQNEQGKVNKYIGKQESLEEKLSRLQSENMSLRQQLDDAQNRADSKEKMVISIQDQFQQIVRKLQAKHEKQGLMLEERNKELIKECIHLKERMCQYENEKAEREAVVRQLQQELADTLRKQSISEVSLEVLSRYCADLEVEAQDLKKNLCQLTSQLQEAQDQLTEAVRCAEKTQDHQAGKIEQLQKNLLDQEKKKNSELEKKITGFKKLLKMTRRKLNEYENGELSFHGDLKTSQTEIDIQINMLKHKVIFNQLIILETASSKCLHLDAKNQVLREELLSMKGMQKKCEKLEKNKKKLEQEVVNLRSHIEMNIQVEQYKGEIEERARQDLVEKLKEVNLFCRLIFSWNSELNKDLESALSKVKTLQEDSHKAELEKYKQLYLVELEVRKSLEGKLDSCFFFPKVKAFLKKQTNKLLCGTILYKTETSINPLAKGVARGPVFLLMEKFKENCRCMRQELDRSITRELRKAAAEFKSSPMDYLLLELQMGQICLRTCF